MRSVLIDDAGRIWSAAYRDIAARVPALLSEVDSVGYAVSELGFIHIRPAGRTAIVVSLRPALVPAVTLVAAFYMIADLRPERVCISVDPVNRACEMTRGVASALRRIERLVAATCTAGAVRARSL